VNSTTPILHTSTSGPTYFFAKICGHEDERHEPLFTIAAANSTTQEEGTTYHLGRSVRGSPAKCTPESTHLRVVTQSKIDQLDVLHAVQQDVLVFDVSAKGGKHDQL
jgi:hypothetical protein